MNMLINQNHLKEDKLKNLFALKVALGNGTLNDLNEFQGNGKFTKSIQSDEVLLSERTSDE